MFTIIKRHLLDGVVLHPSPAGLLQIKRLSCVALIAIKQTEQKRAKQEAASRAVIVFLNNGGRTASLFRGEFLYLSVSEAADKKT